jgi:hypothetical protein
VRAPRTALPSTASTTCPPGRRAASCALTHPPVRGPAPPGPPRSAPARSSPGPGRPRQAPAWREAAAGRQRRSRRSPRTITLPPAPPPASTAIEDDMAGTAPGDDHEVWRFHDRRHVVPAPLSSHSQRVGLILPGQETITRLRKGRGPTALSEIALSGSKTDTAPHLG